MACAAQIGINCRNGQNAAVTKTENGNAFVRLRAMTNEAVNHTIVPVPLHEDTEALDKRISRWTEAWQPRDDAEADMVAHAARLSWMIESADRTETACLDRRLRRVGFQASQTASTQFAEARELGRKLFRSANPANQKQQTTRGWPSCDNDPAVLLHRLEQTEEGCRWVAKRWHEFRNLLNRRVGWSLSDRYRFVRLQGKEIVEAVNDPELNAIFLAWEVILDGSGEKLWTHFNREMRALDPGANSMMHWREIADRPNDVDQAWALIRAVVDQEIGRIEALLAEREELAAVEAAERTDQAALDASPGLDRLRRHRIALGREYIRMMDTLRKMRNAQWKTRIGQKVSVRNDSERVTDQTASVKNGVLSRERADTDKDGIVSGDKDENGKNGPGAPGFPCDGSAASGSAHPFLSRSPGCDVSGTLSSGARAAGERYPAG
jgi:hypothetical protein